MTNNTKSTRGGTVKEELLRYASTDRIEVLKILLAKTCQYSLLPEIMDVVGPKKCIEFMDIFGGQTVDVPPTQSLLDPLRDADIYVSLEKENTGTTVKALSKRYGIPRSHILDVYNNVRSTLTPYGTLYGVEEKKKEPKKPPIQNLAERVRVEGLIGKKVLVSYKTCSFFATLNGFIPLSESDGEDKLDLTPHGGTRKRKSYPKLVDIDIDLADEDHLKKFDDLSGLVGSNIYYLTKDRSNFEGGKLIHLRPDWSKVKRKKSLTIVPMSDIIHPRDVAKLLDSKNGTYDDRT